MARIRYCALAVIPLAALAGFATAAALRRYRPQQIPAALDEGVRDLRRDGWSVCAWHSMWCQDPDPHIHMCSPGGMEFVLYGTGRVRLPRALRDWPPWALPEWAPQARPAYR